MRICYFPYWDYIKANQLEKMMMMTHDSDDAISSNDDDAMRVMTR